MFKALAISADPSAGKAAAEAAAAGTQFTSFTGTKKQVLLALLAPVTKKILTRRLRQRHKNSRASHELAQFTCFTGNLLIQTYKY